MKLSKFIQSLFARKEKPAPTEITVPDNLFVQCPQCKETIFRKKLSVTLDVCPHCGHHFVIQVKQWVQILADNGSWNPLFKNLLALDPLQFPGYKDKLQLLQKQEPEEAISVGECMIDGIPVLLGVMNPKFFMGSLGSVCGEKIFRLFELGLRERKPVILVIRSGGARMQEGVLSLLQMAKTSAIIRRFSEAGLLYLTILTHPTTGGVSASFAMLGDITLAEPGALIGFAGPRVIEQTIRQQLPEGFQKAEYLLQKGFVDVIVARSEMKTMVQRLLRIHSYSPRISNDKGAPTIWKRIFG